MRGNYLQGTNERLPQGVVDSWSCGSCPRSMEMPRWGERGLRELYVGQGVLEIVWWMGVVLQYA